jgi:hypothetical protein
MYMNFIQLLCDWGRRIKPNVLFPAIKLYCSPAQCLKMGRATNSTSQKLGMRLREITKQIMVGESVKRQILIGQRDKKRKENINRKLEVGKQLMSRSSCHPKKR